MVLFDIKGVDNIIKDFDKYINKNDSIMASAMNRGHVAGRSRAIGIKYGVRKVWRGIKSSDLKGLIGNKKATKSNLSTSFILTSKPIKLTYFSAKQKKKGVSYKIQNKQKQLKGSFIAKGQVFRRQTKKRNSIIPYYSITPTTMFKTADSEEVYIERYKAVFTERYLQRLKFLVG